MLSCVIISFEFTFIQVIDILKNNVVIDWCNVSCRKRDKQEYTLCLHYAIRDTSYTYNTLDLTNNGYIP